MGSSAVALSAARSAISSARVLLQARPAATVTSFSSPDGRTIHAPPPPRRTPPSAEPSAHSQTASGGSSARHASAADRRTSSAALLSGIDRVGREDDRICRVYQLLSAAMASSRCSGCAHCAFLFSTGRTMVWRFFGWWRSRSTLQCKFLAPAKEFLFWRTVDQTRWANKRPLYRQTEIRS